MQTPSQAPQVAAVPSGGGKTVLWIILGLVLTILIAGAAYWYLNGQQNKPAQTTVIPTPNTRSNSNLQGDLDAIEIPEVDSNFPEVDKDLGSL